MIYRKASIVLLVSLLAAVLPSMAQKKTLGYDTYKSWWWLDNDYKISNDGKYITYTIDSPQEGPRLSYLVTSAGKQLLATPGLQQAAFSADSRFLVAQLNGDSVAVYDLQKKAARYIYPANNFSLAFLSGKNLMIYLSGGKIVMENLLQGKILFAEDGQEFNLSSAGKIMVVKNHDSLIRVHIDNNKVDTIFKGPTKKILIHDEGTIAFIHPNGTNNLIFYCKPSMSKAAVLLNDRRLFENGYQVAPEGIRFSRRGSRLYFAVTKTIPPLQKDSAFYTDQVEIWNYRRPIFYSAEKHLPFEGKSLQSVIGLHADAKPLLLEDDSTDLISNLTDNFALVKTSQREQEYYYDDDKINLYQLICLEDGSKTILNERTNVYRNCFLSPGERFVYWQSSRDGDIYTYEIASGITSNTTNFIQHKADITLMTAGSPSYRVHPFPERWYAGDVAFLLNDKYDIWRIDPLNIKKPLNITGGYGRVNKIFFLTAIAAPAQPERLNNEPVLLRARNELTGENGFWETTSNFAAPIKKVMGPWIFSWNQVAEPPRLCKAKNANTYIVTRQSARESPNLFTSKNLRTFTQITSIAPEGDYNWMTTEMMTWKKYDGDTGHAILIKPEDFDPTKKYPVVFHFYQEKIESLHLYHRPKIEPNELDIPWYVSNGYIVCLPDIKNIHPGFIARTVVHSIESAARHLSQFPWIDSARFGAQGHSFGGYETLLLIAHSKLFAAAQASAAVSNITSAIGGVGFGDNELYSFYEMGQQNMGPGNLPWNNPQAYIESSPVFFADRINTPLLLMHGYEDANVKFSEDIQMFAALRRLKKPVWILGYKDGHILPDYSEMGKDAALRQKQFFDHYLKGKPPAVWMTKGVPYRDRQFLSGLQLDSVKRIDTIDRKSK